MELPDRSGRAEVLIWAEPSVPPPPPDKATQYR